MLNPIRAIKIFTPLQPWHNRSDPLCQNTPPILAQQVRPPLPKHTAPFWHNRSDPLSQNAFRLHLTSAPPSPFWHNRSDPLCQNAFRLHLTSAPPSPFWHNRSDPLCQNTSPFWHNRSDPLCQNLGSESLFRPRNGSRPVHSQSS